MMVLRKMLSIFVGEPLSLPHCRFYPSCSQYAAEVFRQHFFHRAIILILKRLLRCHPFHPGGVDHPSINKEVL